MRFKTDENLPLEKTRLERRSHHRPRFLVGMRPTCRRLQPRRYGPPAAVLWPDEKREWERLVPRLRVLLPHFLVFGPYDPASRTGPAIWLRCVLAGKVPSITWPPGTVPIIYLPGVSRATLRATEECPHELKPLAELQYRGVFWSQTNGKDWTVTAFLQTEPWRAAAQDRQGPGHGDCDTTSH